MRVVKWGKPSSDPSEDTTNLVTVKLNPGVEVQDGLATVGEDANGHAIVQFSVPAEPPDPSEGLLAMVTAHLADALEALDGNWKVKVMQAGALAIFDDDIEKAFGVSLVALPDAAVAQLGGDDNEGDGE